MRLTAGDLHSGRRERHAKTQGTLRVELDVESEAVLSETP